MTRMQFLLNDLDIAISVAPGMSVLDYLRHEQRLVGTKEGCKEGDCGACVVLIGELRGDYVHYLPITSCMMPVGELHGKHLVTIEGLNRDGLSPIQQAIVDEGGSQCGFCTPGIVVSLTGCLIEMGSGVDESGIKVALGGNLCRCTGYSSLKRAGKLLIKQFGNDPSKTKKSGDHIGDLVARNLLPDSFLTAADKLKKIPRSDTDNGKSAKTFIAGGTDLYVQCGEQLPELQLGILNSHPEMKGITSRNGRIHLGSLTTFEEFADSPVIQSIIPNIKEYMHLNASWQIRNRATIGGNIVNASPIGDMTILLLALESKLMLKTGKKTRTVPMKSFFKGYKKLDIKPSEILTEVIFPKPKPGMRIHFEKVSKRKTLDIASVNSAIRVTNKGKRLQDVQLTMGGVAPIPLFMHATSDFLCGKQIERDTVEAAIKIAMSEISPISDIRGTTDYKRLLVHQLIIAHFNRLFPEIFSVSDYYETH